ncbi:MAG: LuxR C-terminal-related transcriptional regulator [Chloroflexota bacterium]|nr:LuxR C-terminal-related transcriptional regulator [Chloroflexota bacterium]
MLRDSKTIKLYVVEEQEIYRELYKSILPSLAPIELLQVPPDNAKSLSHAISSLCPDVLLMSTKKLDKNVIEELGQVRLSHPDLGIVLLLVFYNGQDIEMLRKLALTGSGGMALFLKQSLDLVAQLYSIIIAVNQGQVILDPLLTGLLLNDKSKSPFLNQLTTRELEILSLISKGYTNSAIADTLYIDLKTVEHHINSMYSKLKAETDLIRRHPRVSAARLYLKAVGELSTSTSSESRLATAYSGRR